MYDYLFVTHLPAFYKVNLYNRLARECRIFVIFIASSSAIRSRDFVAGELLFDHEILHWGDFESRPRISSLGKLLRLLLSLQFGRVVVGGWDLGEFWLTVFAVRRKRIGVVVESTVTESCTSGFKSRLKRLFVSRVATAFPSGALHERLLDSLGFAGKRYRTGGVGILDRKGYAPLCRPFGSSFLYVGRLAPEKNLRFLVEAFNESPGLTLTLVGSGPDARELRQMALGNIAFREHVPNQEIGAVYLDHDVFVLPSLSEPWGLVVEEALHYGLPVLLSRAVGCHTELVAEEMSGLVFDPYDKKSLISALNRISQPELFRRMKAFVAATDFSRRDDGQIAAYVLASSPDPIHEESAR
jgi:glycosyltransferase involved in cell wall biosynthesis